MTSNGDDDPESDSGDDTETGRDCFSADELQTALGALTSLDLKKLGYVGAMLTRGMSMTADELVSDAIQAALVGRRRWPRDVSLLIFLRKVMQSLASSARKAAARSRLVLFPVARGEKNPIELAADCAANPEQALLEREDRQEAERDAAAAKVAARILNARFEHDDEVQLCIAGMMERMKGKELRELLGVDQAKLDYFRKKIRRALPELFPRGWRNVHDQA